jgi:hypothetical protein
MNESPLIKSREQSPNPEKEEVQITPFFTEESIRSHRSDNKLIKMKEMNENNSLDIKKSLTRKITDEEKENKSRHEQSIHLNQSKRLCLTIIGHQSHLDLTNMDFLSENNSD